MENASGSQPGGKSSMLEQTQQQVNDVVSIMRVNVEKVLERDQKLSELDSRADALQEGGRRFEQQAQKLKRKYWWKNLKMMIILGVIAVVILIIIILSFMLSDSSDKPAAAAAANIPQAPVQAVPSDSQPLPMPQH
ncbi:PREDICTED: vesicle-associated membrane protein 3-like [Nicrophorus vespilloides]|uniref:Vesicle-associated membrane protein 3-like n=1 Tax=Nicrophorus vespilloides TaxID=110193 RepID=A0ABM1NFW1_NICVS|nr:PREDICTED: vesicle-associated membrane protein 3-like [Nicrophorus vespilloides]